MGEARRTAALLTWARLAGVVLASIGLTLAIGSGIVELVDRARYAKYRQRELAALRAIVASPDGELVWQYRPNWHGKQLTTNRYGFRERPLATALREPDAYRIAFVGDSVTVGADVREDEMFTRRLAALLSGASASPRLETLNFGVTGYNAVQVAAVVRKSVGAFRPDEVVYVMCLNDFDLDYDASGPLMLLFRPPESFVLWRIDRLRESLAHTEYHAFHYGENAARVYEAIGRMAHDAAAFGARFRVLLMPVLSAGFDYYPWAWMHREVTKTLAASGVEVVDLLPAFRAAGRRYDLFGYDTWHLRPAGHEFVARALVGHLDTYRTRVGFTVRPKCSAPDTAEQLEVPARKWYSARKASLSRTCEDFAGTPKVVEDALSFDLPAAPRSSVIGAWIVPTLDRCTELEVRVPPWQPRRYATAVGGWLVAAALPLPEKHEASVTLSAVRATDCAAAKPSPIRIASMARVELDVPLRMRLSLDSPRLELDGFWPREPRPRGLAAWTRRQSALTIDLPWPGKPVDLTLHVLDVGPLARLKIRAGDLALDADLKQVKASGKLAVGVVQVGPDGRVRLSFESATWRPADAPGGAADDRQLGVYVQAVEVGVAGDAGR